MYCAIHRHHPPFSFNIRLLPNRQENIKSNRKTMFMRASYDVPAATGNALFNVLPTFAPSKIGRLYIGYSFAGAKTQSHVATNGSTTGSCFIGILETFVIGPKHSCRTLLVRVLSNTFERALVRAYFEHISCCDFKLECVMNV